MIEEALVLLLKEYGADPVEAARARKMRRLEEILRDIDTMPLDADREIRSTDDLYDDATGLPR